MLYYICITVEGSDVPVGIGKVHAASVHALGTANICNRAHWVQDSKGRGPVPVCMPPVPIQASSASRCHPCGARPGTHRKPGGRGSIGDAR